MPDEEKIKEVLREDLRPGAHVTEGQLDEVTREVVERGEISGDELEDIAAHVVGDKDVFIEESVDMGTIKDELDRDQADPPSGEQE